jgi:hypothetical protein
MNHASRVRVTLRLTVSQSVRLGVEPRLGLMTRYLLFFDSYCLVFRRAPFSDERTGLSFVRFSQQYYVNCHYEQFFFLHFTCFTCFGRHMEYMQGFCQSGLSTAHDALFQEAFATTAVKSFERSYA